VLEPIQEHWSKADLQRPGDGAGGGLAWYPCVEPVLPLPVATQTLRGGVHGPSIPCRPDGAFGSALVDLKAPQRAAGLGNADQPAVVGAAVSIIATLPNHDLRVHERQPGTL
jgi:hypothetical protein